MTFFVIAAALAVVIETADGRRLEGELSIADATFSVVNTNALMTNYVELKELKSLRVPSAPITNAVPEGLMLVNGLVVAGKIVRADDSVITCLNLGQQYSISRVNVARVFLRSVADLNVRRPGLLLRNNDFVDAELVDIKDGKIRTTSVLFGSRTYPTREVAQIFLRQPRPIPRQFEIRTRDLSRFSANSLGIISNSIVLNGILSTNLVIPISEIAEIKRH